MPEYDENDNEIREPESEGMAGLRNAKKAAEAEQKRLQEELASAQADRSELAAMKAGLDPSDKQAAFFLKHYDGDLTADAMKAAAIEAGVLPEVEAQAQASVQGQAQMAAAFQGGEHVPLGTTTIGDRNLRIQVPAEQAEAWQQFEAAVKVGDYQGGQDILRQFGLSDPTAIVPGGHEYEPGAGAPHTTPISGRPL